MSLKTAVILAAGMGIRLSPIVGIHPKGLLQIGELPLLGRSLNFLKKNGFEKILIVSGHQSKVLERELDEYTNCFNTQFVFNERYSETGSMHSLFMLHEKLDEDFLLLESDLLYGDDALKYLLQTKERDLLLISGRTGSGDEVWIYGEEPKENNNMGLVKKISKQSREDFLMCGELTGLSKISKELFNKMCVHHKNNNQFPNNYHYEECISDLSNQHSVKYLLVDGLVWTEIDDPQHYERALNEIWPLLKNK